MKNRPAISLIEFLVAILIFTIVSGILVAIFISGWRVFHRQSAQVDTQGQAKLVTSTVVRETQQALRVLEDQDFSGTLYASSSDTLIIELPSIDASQKVIEGSFDYKVFYLDPVDTRKLKLITEADSASIRKSETRTIANLISSLSFVYKKEEIEVEPEEAEIITVSVTTSLVSFGRTEETSLVGQAKLRNK